MHARLLAASALALAAAAFGAYALQSADASPASVDPTPIRADNFRLVDQTGFSHELYRYKTAKAVVIAAQLNGDESSRKAALALAALKQNNPGVEVLMINASGPDTRESVAAEMKAMGIDLPVLDDDLQLVSESLNIAYTGEVFLIDPKTWTIAYHGAVDGSLSKSRKKAGRYLAEALSDLAAGRKVEVAETQGKGAMIDLPGRRLRGDFASISYSTTVAPILEAKCVECHQEGGIGPFSMVNYNIVRGFAPMIREVIRTDRMPPWHSDDDIGSFQHNKSLTKDEIKTLVHWIEAGAPRGEGPDPLATTPHKAPDWPLGKPDVIIDIPEYALPASGIVDYQYPAVALNLPEGKWLKASTVKAGARQGVHHVLTGLLNEVPKDAKAATSQWGASVGGYAVGSESVRMPENVGTWIPAKGGVGFQMHYTPFGRAATDKSQLALYFYKDNEKPDLMMRQSVVIDTSIELPPNEPRHREIAYLKFPKDALLYSVFPHAHYRGIYTDIELHTPDGKIERLMATPYYDFNWQREYEFETPVKIPAGSKLVAHYIFDNSAANPSNPDPNIKVTWGEQSHEEMLFSNVRYRWADETVEKPTNYDDLMDQNMIMGMMDDNLDEKLQVSELRGRLGAQVKPLFAKLDVNSDGGLDTQEFVPVQQRMMSERRARNLE